MKFLAEMLPDRRAASRTRPCATGSRDRLAFKARVTDEVVRARDSARRLSRSRPPFTTGSIPSFGQVTKAEKGLIWWLVHDPDRRLTALDDLEAADFEGLASRSVLDLARKLNEDRGFSPSVLLERLSMVEAQLVTGIASEPEPPVLDAAVPAYVSSARSL